VRRLANVIGEISSASEDQGCGIEQVKVAVSQMVQVIQQNAALVEEAEAAAQSLLEQAARLNQMAPVFTVSVRPGTKGDPT
jgi:methyl-accepting chemotaxis protein